MKSLFLIVSFVSVFVFSGCSNRSLFREDHADTSAVGTEEWERYEDEADEQRISDPLEGVNRRIFAFNDGFYKYAARPLANVYKEVTPKFLRKGISNAFDNAKAPVRVANQLLQGKPKAATQEVGKFMVNSTEGLLGTMKASDKYPDLNPPQEDFGQTLAYWGIGRGPYLVVPVLGPLTTRDAVGRAGDWFLDPVPYLEEWEWRFGLSATENVNDIPGILAVYDAITGSAIDKYEAVKDGYVQRRELQGKE